jgi:GT2 family glycosyltransferase
LFLNPDASLTPQTLSALLEAAARHPSASVFNPVIRGQSGKARLRKRSLPKRGWFQSAGDLPETDCEVTGLSGAALFVKRADFEAVGGFDPDIFLYHEDEDLCFRLRQSCGPLMFVRKAEVHHIGGASTPSSLTTVAFKGWHMGRSGAYVARKNNKPGGYGRAVANALLQLVSPLCWISRRKRVKQYAILRGVLSAAQDDGHGFKDTPWQD